VLTAVGGPPKSWRPEPSLAPRLAGHGRGGAMDAQSPCVGAFVDIDPPLVLWTGLP